MNTQSDHTLQNGILEYRNCLIIAYLGTAVRILGRSHCGDLWSDTLSGRSKHSRQTDRRH